MNLKGYKNEVKLGFDNKKQLSKNLNGPMFKILKYLKKVTNTLDVKEERIPVKPLTKANRKEQL